MNPSKKNDCQKYSAANEIKDFYGFQKLPFSPGVSLESEFIFLGKNYEMPLAILVSSLDKGIHLILILGPNGVGKTTLINYLHGNIQNEFALGFVSAICNTAQDIYQHTLQSFGQKINIASQEKTLQQLRKFLTARFKKQQEQPTLLIFDNADCMSSDALLGIEVLLSLTFKGNRILQIILVGDFELESIMKTPKLQSLSKIIGKTCHLEALSAYETKEYIYQHLKDANLEDDKMPFDQESCSVIYQYSKGIPEKINSICNDALQASSLKQQYKINSALIHEVSKFDRHEKTSKNPETLIESVSSEIINTRKTGKFSNTAILFLGLFIGISILVILGWEKLFDPSENTQVLASNHRNEDITRKQKQSQTERSKKLEQEIKQTEKIITIPREIKPESTETVSNFGEETPKNDNIEIPLATQESGLDLVSERVQKLLEKAELQFTELKFTTPKNDNAYASYTAILDIEPNEQQALKGLERIANRYLKLAKKQKIEGALDKSLYYINLGLKVASDHNKLILLKKQVNTALLLQKQQDKAKSLAKQVTEPAPILDDTPIQIEDQAVSKDTDNESTDIEKADFALLEAQKSFKEKQLQNLLIQAKQQLKSHHLVKPVGDNAFDSYQKILNIDPENKIAKAGLINIENKYQTMAQNALAQGQTDQVIAIANEGLSTFPANQNLRKLRDDATLQKDLARKENELKIQKKERKMRPYANF